MITLQYTAHSEFGPLDTASKIRKILRSVKEDKILVIEGKMSPEEEAELITCTMEQIDKRFKGIEIASLDPQKRRNQDFLDVTKRAIANYLLGKNEGLTIIGPASIVKEIKRDPNKIELLTKMNNKRKK